MEASATVVPVAAAARWDSEARLCHPDCSEVPDIACSEWLRHDSAKRSSRSPSGRPVSGCQSFPTESLLLKFDRARERLDINFIKILILLIEFCN